MTTRRAAPALAAALVLLLVLVLPAAAAVMQVFVRDGCPHCADAKVFVDRLQRERPGLRVEFRDVGRDDDAAADLETLSRAAGVWPPGVPTFAVGDVVLVGFDDDAHAGRQLIGLLDRGEVARGELHTRWFGTLGAGAMGLPAFTLALGLIDGFNPCAM